MSESLDQKQSVQARFGPAAGNYASAGVHKSGPDLEAMLPAAAPTGSERVLDVGCGAGHTAIAFAPHVQSVDAVDLTPAMLEQTDKLAERAGARNLTTRLGDVEALPYPDRQFEIVTCRLCAHHFGQPGRALSEIARVLAPGGQLILVDIVSPEPPEQDTFLNTLEMLRDPSHVRDHSLSQWLAMLGAAGLAPELLATWPMRLDFERWLRRIGASPEAEVGLRALFGAASRGVRDHFEIAENLDFTITNALLRATRIG
jgi:ubiquinone/menaquinone biosynthesis C-methylase UbiE